MTQNEKDRFQLESLRKYIDPNDAQMPAKKTQKMLFELADRLLTERENAEVVYRDSSYSDTEFWREDELGCFKKHMQLTKGIWIPVEEAE
ncbi:hypothetical protein HCI99_06205 [Listeria booriae]|uniref:Uncharacterized protein n=1 Tax=Listeria booriae TaxID=1552123 RepID=A0A7X0XC53_9LIST|nr:hypothetical protein [Listeria booriae]MBC1491414.1 hypothetical protein [Listeria booriae]MBC6150096.1 hypothetical protein [Listeria booriae]